MKKLFVILLLIGYCVNLLTVKTHAQSPEFSLIVDPNVFEARINQGGEIETKIYIRNTSDKKVELDINIRPIRSDSNGKGNIILLNKTNPQERALQEQIKVYEQDIEITKVNLSQNEAKELYLRVKVPAETKSGDYYFALIFTSSTSIPQTQASSIAISPGIGLNLLFSVGTPSPIKGAIENFSAPFFLTSGPVPFTLLFENLSSNFIKPEGNISIFNMFGNHVGEIKLGPSYVLGGSKRYLSDQSSNPNNLIWKEKLLFGVYNAKLNLFLSENGPTFKTSIYFFSLPLYLLLALSVIIFILIGIYIRIKKRIGRGHIRKDEANKSRN